MLSWDSYTGLSADYVYRETKRSLDGVAGTKTLLWPGIDIDIPTEPGHSQCTPQKRQQFWRLSTLVRRV